MAKEKVIFKLTVVLFCLLALAGCGRSAKERDKAIAEAEKAKADLARAETALEKTQRVIDELGGKIAGLSRELDNTKSQLAAAEQAQGDLINQIGELAEQRDLAVARAENAQALVEELKKQLIEKSSEQEGEEPAEQAEEEAGEETEEETADANSE
jgi:predicted  nucleic acid-binding Zn-ribbon protein